MMTTDELLPLDEVAAEASVPAAAAVVAGGGVVVMVVLVVVLLVVVVVGAAVVTLSMQIPVLQNPSLPLGKHAVLSGRDAPAKQISLKHRPVVWHGPL